MEKSFFKLINWVESEKYRGWDPYDILNSWLPFNMFGSWGPVIATQIHKRNPINIRPLIGIKKGYIPKGVGLFLKAYCNLYRLTKDEVYLEQAATLYEWLRNNYSRGYSGYCWGINFPWASPGDYKKAYIPSVVVTSVVIDGIYEYFKITNFDEAKYVIMSAAEYVLDDIPVTTWDEGISYAYTHKDKGVCYNASLHAAEVLVRAKTLGADIDDMLILEAVNYIVSRQKGDGSWYYSYDPAKDNERKQIDFHQGFILVSLYNIMCMLHLNNISYKESILKGLNFYWNKQFHSSGRSYWRLPKKYPVDIHNQSQGVITFSILSGLDSNYLSYAEKVLSWTIDNMQAKRGYFYYRINPFFIDRTPYIRWGQAWMLLAFSEFMLRESKLKKLDYNNI